jgi:hypothetical protein
MNAELIFCLSIPTARLRINSVTSYNPAPSF